MQGWLLALAILLSYCSSSFFIFSFLYFPVLHKITVASVVTSDSLEQGALRWVLKLAQRTTPNSAKSGPRRSCFAANCRNCPYSYRARHFVTQLLWCRCPSLKYHSRIRHTSHSAQPPWLIPRHLFDYPYVVSLYPVIKISMYSELTN